MEILHEPEFWVAVGFVLVIGLLLYGRAGHGRQDAGRTAPPPSRPNWTRPAAFARKPQALLADYRRKPPAPKPKPHAIVTEARAEAARFAAESRTALEAQIERRAQQAQDKIAQAEAAAMAEIRALAADAAAAAAEKLIAARIDEEARRRDDRRQHQGPRRQAELTPKAPSPGSSG